MYGEGEEGIEQWVEKEARMESRRIRRKRKRRREPLNIRFIISLDQRMT